MIWPRGVSYDTSPGQISRVVSRVFILAAGARAGDAWSGGPHAPGIPRRQGTTKKKHFLPEALLDELQDAVQALQFWIFHRVNAGIACHLSGAFEAFEPHLHRVRQEHRWKKAAAWRCISKTNFPRPGRAGTAPSRWNLSDRWEFDHEARQRWIVHGKNPLFVHDPSWSPKET